MQYHRFAAADIGLQTSTRTPASRAASLDALCTSQDEPFASPSTQTALLQSADPHAAELHANISHNIGEIVPLISDQVQESAPSGPSNASASQSSAADRSSSLQQPFFQHCASQDAVTVDLRVSCEAVILAIHPGGALLLCCFLDCHSTHP